MFDIQVIPYLETGSVSEEVLASIRRYYLRVTIQASPMGSFVGVVMLVGIVLNTIRLFRSGELLVRRIASEFLMVVPTTWALLSIVPSAQRLANESLGTAEQSELAVYIFWAHVCCLIMIIALIATQFLFRTKTDQNS